MAYTYSTRRGTDYVVCIVILTCMYNNMVSCDYKKYRIELISDKKMITGRSSTWNTELSNGLPAQCEVHRPHNNSPATRPTSPIRNVNLSSTAIDQDERMWGEILERSLSSGSLHHLHRLNSDHHDNGPPNIETASATWNNKRIAADVNWSVSPQHKMTTNTTSINIGRSQ